MLANYWQLAPTEQKEVIKANPPTRCSICGKDSIRLVSCDVCGQDACVACAVPYDTIAIHRAGVDSNSDTGEAIICTKCMAF
jgi:hypothetical protein